MYDRWFNLKAAFNPRTGLARAWIDDRLVKVRQYRTGTSGWYFKNGTYNNGLPEGGVSVAHFRNIHIYRNDGNGQDPTTPPGAPPGRPDPGPGPPRPDPGPGGPELAFEAESLPVGHSGTGTAVETDDRTSGGRWVSLQAENAGSWMEFTLPGIPAGRYTVKLRYKSHSDRGQVSLRIDGTQPAQQLGDVLDQYSSPEGYQTASFGSIELSAGGHRFRLIVAGKNPESRGFIISADAFLLE
jgi:hypothetical protein